MARYSKKKVIKKKSVNKNKNKNTRVKKRRVSRGKSRRRVKRKYRGGGDGDGVDYIRLKDKMNKKEYYDYAKKLAELIYRVLHIIFILSENKNKEDVLKLLMTGYKVTDSAKRKKITAFLNELLGIVFKYYKKKEKTGGGDLNFKTGSRKYTVTRTTASGLTELGFLQEFGIVMAKADADELSYFFDTSIPDQSVQEILFEESGSRSRITSTAPPDVINTFSTFLNNPVELPDGDAGDLAGHILLATKAAIDTVEYKVTNQPGDVINFDLVLKRVGDLSLDDELDIFLSKIVKINDSAREAFKSLVSTL